MRHQTMAETAHGTLDGRPELRGLTEARTGRPYGRSAEPRTRGIGPCCARSASRTGAGPDLSGRKVTVPSPTAVRPTLRCSGKVAAAGRPVVISEPSGGRAAQPLSTRGHVRKGLSQPAWRRPPGTSRLTRYLRGMSVDRGKYHSKIHSITERTGLPLSIGMSGANLHDSQALEPPVRGIPPVRSRRGPRRRRPGRLHADKGCAYDHPRRWLRTRGIRHRIARRPRAQPRRP